MKKIIFLLCVLFAPLPAFAVGIQMQNYSEVMVENLQIGTTYSMVQLVNLPLKIANTTNAAIVVELGVEIPKGAKIKKGFEAIPEKSWVRIAGNNEVTIPANGAMETDVMIEVPNDQKLFGKKFHVAIIARVKPPKASFVAIALQLEGRLLFSIAPIKAAGIQPATDLNYEVQPARLQMKDVPLGQKVEVVSADKKPFQVVNNSKQAKKFFLYSIDPKKTIVSILPEVEACPHPDFLSLEKDEVEISGRTAKQLRMFVEIPNQPEYAGKSYQFIVSVEMEEKGLTQRYVTVLIETKK